MKRLKKQKGFTLMELVATITIVVVLSIISGPIYTSFSGRAKVAEGYVLLGTIRSAQERYYSEHGCFLDRASSSSGLNKVCYTCNDEVVGIDARTNLYYTSFDIGGCATASQGQYYMFESVVQAKGLPSITMKYNRTAGVTMY